MKGILSSAFFLGCLTLQCNNFMDSAWNNAQASLLHSWNFGSQKIYTTCDRIYSKMPSQEEAKQRCIDAMQWVTQKTPPEVKEKIDNIYQTSREKILLGYTWIYKNTPSQEEVEQKSQEAYEWAKGRMVNTHQYFDTHIPEGFKRWVGEKKNFSFDISKKIYLNVGVWLSKLGTVIEQTNL